MARVSGSTRVAAAAPAQLTLDLFGPGMTPLHRAGLGGLACTLRSIERKHGAQHLPIDNLPGEPWGRGRPPWSITATSITLDFRVPQNAREFLRRLFRSAFGLKDDLIHLPGQYPEEPPLEVRAELQSGIILTFLQHGRVRKLAREPTTFQYDPEGRGTPVVVEYRRCSWYKHQDGWEELIDRHGQLRVVPLEVVGPLNPGAVVRHVAFSAQTKIEDPPERLLPLYFSLVGCLALSVNRGVGVLIVPEVADLLAFARLRPLMTPTSGKDCRIASASDAALQAQVRLKSKAAIEACDLPGCYAMTFKPTTWSTQQKSRVATVYVPPGDDERLSRFEVALVTLAPRIRMRTVRETTGRGRQRRTVERTEYFWGDSAVRPVVADNLALGRPWYIDFTRLMFARDANGTPLRRKVFFEREGLHAMTENICWEREYEAVLVRAVHQAIRNSFGRIRSDTDRDRPGPPSPACLRRWDRFKERLRLSLVGAKTPDQCRAALCALFGKAGVNPELQQNWEKVLPMLSDQHWQQARDLALLALASYAGREGEDRAPDTTTTGP